MAALLSVLAYVVIIVVGVVLRQFGLVPRDLAKPVGFLILNVTLPCAIVTFLSGVKFDPALLFTILLPIAATWVMIGVAWLLTHRRADAAQATPFAMLNMSSYNVGTFAMPFTMGLVPPLGFLVICLFDVGNGVMCAGGTYAFACRGSGGAWAAMKGVAHALLRAAPLWTYIWVIALTFMDVTLPKPLLHVFEVIGSANSFLSMLFIGLSINLEVNWEKLKGLLGLMVVRYLVNALLALLLFFTLPFPLEVRQAITLVMMSPLPVLGIVFTMKAKLDWESAANINSISVAASIVIMCAMLSVFTA